MKRFEWRLQRVLDIKQKEEQVKRAELVHITEQLSQMRVALFLQKRILEDLLEELAEAHPHERLSRQAMLMTYSAPNDRKIKELQENVNNLAAQQQEKLAEILKLKQFNEGLEKLRADAQEEYFKEQETLEQKAMDEASTSRFARQRMA
jgi:flagellar export protein FliJ